MGMLGTHPAVFGRDFMRLGRTTMHENGPRPRSYSKIFVFNAAKSIFVAVAIKGDRTGQRTGMEVRPGRTIAPPPRLFLVSVFRACGPRNLMKAAQRKKW